MSVEEQYSRYRHDHWSDAGFKIVHVLGVFVVVDRAGEQVSPHFFHRAAAKSWADDEHGRYRLSRRPISVGDIDYSDRTICRRVRRLIGDTFTDAECGRFFGVSGRTFNRCKNEFPPPAIGIGGLSVLLGVSPGYLFDGVVKDAADLAVANSDQGRSKIAFNNVMEAIHG